MSSATSHDPEHRWRRTVEHRGRPVKLKVGRLLRGFGFTVLDARTADLIEDRLAQVGVHVRPPLADVTTDAVITLELMLPSAGYVPTPTSDFPAVPQTSDFPAVSQPPADDEDRLADAEASDGRRFGSGQEDDPSLLVQAAVEAERRAREAYEQASASAAQRIADLEREIAADREAAERAREELELRKQEEREAAAKLDEPSVAAPAAADDDDAAVDEPDAEPQPQPERAKRKQPPLVEAKLARDAGPAPERATSDEPAFVWHDAEPAPPAAPLAVPEEISARRVRTPYEAHRRAGRLRLAAVVLALAALGAGGYGLGRDGAQPAERVAALTGPAMRAGIALRHPAGWERRAKAPEIPGLRFRSPLAIGPPGQRSTGIVAGIVTGAVGSDLLPAELRKRLPDAPPKPDPVLLGDIQALRYSTLELVGHPSAVTLFAVPTAEGSAIVACHAPIEAGAFFDDCERAAATLRLDGLRSPRLDGARALPLGPSQGYAGRLRSAIAAVERALAGDGERLRVARTARAQATIASSIARAYSRVADDLDDAAVSARDSEGHAGLVAAIRAGASAYEDLAAAARDGDRDDYADARDAVRDAAKSLRDATAALRKLGYGS